MFYSLSIMYRLLSLTLAVLACTPLCAIDENAPNVPPNRHWTFTFQMENDIFANTDSDYTNGIRMSWISPDLLSYDQAGTVPGFIYRLSEYLPFIHEPAMQRNVAITIGQNMYTPEDISSHEPNLVDRPYAGWLYFGVAFHNKTARWLDIMEMNIGVVGPWSYAEQAQTIVHRAIDSPIPNGWDYQVGNEVVVNLVWERKIRFIRLGDARGPAADTVVHFGGSLGTLYTYANTGLTGRIGWNLPTDFGTSTIRLAGDTNAPAVDDDPRLRDSGCWGVNVFGSVDCRAVARDGTLDGNLFSGNEGVTRDKYPFVADLSAGASLILGNWKLSYAQVARSREFKGQRQEWHSFGSVTVSCTY